MLLIYLGICWLLGLWLASVVNLPLTLWIGVGVSSFLLTIFFRAQYKLAVGLLCLSVVGFAGARYITAVPTINETHIAFYNDKNDVTISGIIVDEPDVRDRFTNIRVATEEIVLRDGTAVSVSGLVQMRTFRYPELTYGMRVVANGRLETPPENSDFSYKDYLARQDVYSLMELPFVEVIAENKGNPIYHTIFKLKAHAQATIEQLIPAPQSALLTGILLGNDNNIPPELAEDFRTTGMTHIIAISGFNIAILIAILVGIADPWLPRKAAVLFAIAGITLYTILVGADASVVRAAIMGGIYLIAVRWLGRPNFAFASLFLAAIVMTLIRPFTLWDVGFQLSFAATLSLMLFATPLTQWTQKQMQKAVDQQTTKKIMGIITEAIIITVAAQILTLPLMVGYFQQLSLISLVANALILPAQPAVMIWGGLATMLGMISTALGQLFAWVAWLFLSYTIELVRIFASLPGAAVSVNISWPIIILIYALIAGVTFYVSQSSTEREVLMNKLRQNFSQRFALTFSALTALLVVGWGGSQPDGQLHIAFMNVGQGDATFIQTPSGRQILVDGGFYPSILNEQLGKQMPFWDKNIDFVIATHPDADHVSALVEVFERYDVDTLITDGEGFGESPIYDAVLAAAEANGATIRPALTGELIEIGDGVRLEALHPGAELDADARNENSVSMRLIYEDFSFLFTGDAEQKAEETMLANGRNLHALVYKAGHHGSNSSSSAAFLDAIRPQIIVVSAGKDNRFGHPHPDMLKRAQAIGATILRTDQLGTIQLTTDGETMWWEAAP